MKVSGGNPRLLVIAVIAAAMTAGCPLPFDFSGSGPGSSHTSDPSSPNMTAAVTVSYSEEGGTSGTLANDGEFVSGKTTTVTLATTTNNSVIYYTDDGSQITNYGTPRKISGSSGQLTVTRSTAVQTLDIHAVAIGPNMLPSQASHVTLTVSPHPILSVTRDKATASEDGGTATFTIMSSSPASGPITVNLQTGGDYQPTCVAGLPAAGTSFPATLAQSATTITLPITAQLDTDLADETVTLKILPDTNQPPQYTVGVTTSAQIVFQDPKIPTYTVTYAGNGSNGGTVPIDGTAYHAGDTVTVLGPGTMTNSSGFFVGWNTNAGGTGTTYGAGNTFVIGAGNVTLYAMWVAVTGTTITSVPQNATNVVIPEGITDFGTAFRSHASLTSVTIPSTVTTITVQAFLGCPQLAAIISNNARYQVINGALVDTVSGVLKLVPPRLSGAFIMPSVTSIDPYAFDSCAALTSITIPSSLTTIGSTNAFSGLRSLIPIVLPSTVTVIGGYAFYNSYVTSVAIPASVTSIGTSAMASCNDLANVSMQSSAPPTLVGTTVFAAPLPTIHVPSAAAVAAYQADPSWSFYGLSIVTP